MLQSIELKGSICCDVFNVLVSQFFVACNSYIDVIDRLFVLRNRFLFLFANVFTAQFTVISVYAKVYLVKFQQKISIRKSFFLKFCVFVFVYSRKFQSRKFSTLKILSVFTLKTRDINWRYTIRSEDVLAVCLTSYVRSIYVLCPGGSNFSVFKEQCFSINFKIFVSIIICILSLCRRPLQKFREFHVKGFLELSERGGNVQLKEVFLEDFHSLQIDSK